jgi:hypothetical protein
MPPRASRHLARSLPCVKPQRQSRDTAFRSRARARANFREQHARMESCRSCSEADRGVEMSKQRDIKLAFFSYLSLSPFLLPFSLAEAKLTSRLRSMAAHKGAALSARSPLASTNCVRFSRLQQLLEEHLDAWGAFVNPCIDASFAI